MRCEYEMSSQSFLIRFNFCGFVIWVIVCSLVVIIENNKSEFSRGFKSKLQTTRFFNVILVAAAASTSLCNSVPADLDIWCSYIALKSQRFCYHGTCPSGGLTESSWWIGSQASGLFLNIDCKVSVHMTCTQKLTKGSLLWLTSTRHRCSADVQYGGKVHVEWS